MKKLIFLISITFVFYQSVWSQTSHTISGLIVDDNGVGMVYANVLLIHPIDSTLIKGAVTTENGAFKFENVPMGQYQIMGNMVGFKSVYSPIFNLVKGYTVPTITLHEGEVLNEVLVEARKPLYQQKVDRMVINVARSIV